MVRNTSIFRGLGASYMKGEHTIEQNFRLQCKLHGCKAIKFEDPGEAGAPDRLVITPMGLTFFVEFKQPGEKPRRNQLKYMLKLNQWGFLAFAACEVDTPLHVILMLQNSNDRDKLYKSLCAGQCARLRKEIE